MKISVRQAEKLSLDQIRAFLDASEEVQFEGEKREEIYGWVNQTLQIHSYGRRNRAERGLPRSYLAKLTGLSRAQVTRLIGRYLECDEVRAPKYKRHCFAASYTRADIELLAAVDEAHDTLSRPATKRTLEREQAEYGKKEYQRLAGYGHIASAHAEAISRFYCGNLNPYVNLHRPCCAGRCGDGRQGPQETHYRRYQTPLETLLAIENYEQFLRPGQSAGKLRQQAARRSDTEAARQMHTAKQKLFASFRKSA